MSPNSQVGASCIARQLADFPCKPCAGRAMLLAGSGRVLWIGLAFHGLCSFRELQQVVKRRTPIVLQPITGVTGAIDAPFGEQGVPAEGVIPLCCHDGISKLAGRIAPRIRGASHRPCVQKKGSRISAAHLARISALEGHSKTLQIRATGSGKTSLRVQRISHQECSLTNRINVPRSHPLPASSIWRTRSPRTTRIQFTQDAANDQLRDTRRES